MRKHFLILMLMAVLPLAASATALNGQTFKKTFFKYTVLTHNVETMTGTVKIEMDEESTIGSQTVLTIPEQVKQDVVSDEYTGQMTFFITEIVESGFYGLSSLEKVNFPASLRKIGASAFAGCYVLGEIHFLDGCNLNANGLGASAFGSWVSETCDLSELTTLKELPAKLFLTTSALKNSYLKHVILPTSITDVSTALANLEKLESVNINETKLASLAEKALVGTKLTSLELPATCLSVADGALAGTKIATLTINSYQTDDSQVIGEGTGNLYGAVAADLDVLNSVTFKGAFKGTVKAKAFQGNTSLAAITFDAISGEIEAGAFTNNAALATITTGAISGTINASFASTLAAGADLTIAAVNGTSSAAASIEDGAFAGLKSVTITNGINRYASTGAASFAGDNLATITIGAVDGTVGASFDSNLATDGAVVTIASIGANGSIAGDAFDNAKTITIGDVAGTIADEAFAGDYLESIQIGTVTGTIGAGTNPAFASTLAEGADLTIAAVNGTSTAPASIEDGAFAGLKSVTITNGINRYASTGAASFAGDNLATITIGAVDGTVGASFDSNLATDGAVVTIASIGANGSIAGDAFDNAKTITIGDVAGTIADEAFAGDYLESIQIGTVTGTIGAGTNPAFASTLAAGAALTIASVGTGANLKAKAFTGINGLTITDGISAGSFAAGAFVYILTDGDTENDLAANLGNISGGAFTANMITGPATSKDLVLTVGNVSSTVAGFKLQNSFGTNLKKVIFGEISKPVYVEALGDAPEAVFGNVVTGGSITGTPTANTTLTKVTFADVAIASGITNTSFTNCTKLAEVNFNGSLALNAVAANAFKTAGSGNTADTDGNKMVVTYKPTGTMVKAFNIATFGADGDGRVVKLVTTQAFYAQYVDDIDNLEYFYRVKAEFSKAAEIATIEFGANQQAVGGYYYSRMFVNSDETAWVAKTPGLTIYSVYTDGEDIYMNPLRVYGGKYQINGASATRAALVVKSNSKETIEYKKNDTGVEAPTKQSVQLTGVAAEDKYGLLYNDVINMTGAKIVMEHDQDFFKLANSDLMSWDDIQAANRVMWRMSNPASANSIKFGYFDPEDEANALAPFKMGSYYLLAEAPAAAPAHIIWLDEDGNTTAIETIETAAANALNANDAIYNLQGVRVDNVSQKGIYIQNGKKFVVK